MKKRSLSLDSNLLIPEFSLPSTEGGRALGTRELRQQSNLVIFFFEGWSCDHCRRMLRSLAAQAGLFEWLEARVLAIAPVPLTELMEAAAELSPAVTFLTDEDGSVTERFGREMGADSAGGADGAGEPAGSPFLVIADRWGAFFTVMEMDEGDEIDFHEVEATLLFIATQCPECGRPDRT